MYHDRAPAAVTMTLLSRTALILLAPGTLLAHELPSVDADTTILGIVDTVIVAGNKKTVDYVILDEMTLKQGSTVTPAAIEYDRNRIYSLGLFTSVDIVYDSLPHQRFLLVDVRERWFLIPLPIFGFRDGDPEKPYYGAGLIDNNFRGRNQKVYVSAIFGFDPSFSFSFTDPLLSREHALFIGTSVSTSNVRNRSLVESALTGNFDERHVELNGTLGKRLTLFETVYGQTGTHYVRVSQYRQGRTASTDGTDLFLYLSVGFMRDTRDLAEYAMTGSMMSLTYTKNGFGEGKVDFSRFGVDLRKYVPITQDVSIAGRVHGQFVSGTIIPTYSRAYFGSSERIRGEYQTIREGENIAGSSLELRWIIFGPKTFLFSALHFPPEFAVWRFGVALAAFTDNGAAWYRHDRVTPGDFASGYGAGIHFLLPYSYVLRTEYAWNKYGQGQFIIDLRTSF
jgi:outer membrane protein assembly factor BamA